MASVTDLTARRELADERKRVTAIMSHPSVDIGNRRLAEWLVMAGLPTAEALAILESTPLAQHLARHPQGPDDAA